MNNLSLILQRFKYLKIKEMKKLLLLVVLPFLMAACCNQQKCENQQNDAEAVVVPVEIAIFQFDSLAPTLVGDTVIVKGTADHVCRGTGRRVFLVDENGGRVKVESSEEMPPFGIENEGKTFVVKGVVEDFVIDENYLKEWEEKVKAGTDEHQHIGGGKPMTEEEKAAGHHIDDPALQQIANFRAQIAEKGVDALHFYSVICTEFKVDEPQQ